MYPSFSLLISFPFLAISLSTSLYYHGAIGLCSCIHDNGSIQKGNHRSADQFVHGVAQRQQRQPCPEVRAIIGQRLCHCCSHYRHDVWDCIIVQISMHEVFDWVHDGCFPRLVGDPVGSYGGHCRREVSICSRLHYLQFCPVQLCGRGYL